MRVSILATLVVISFAMSLPVCAQVVTIKLVDGRNGRPMSKAHVNVWADNTSKQAEAIQTDENGVVRVHLREGEPELRIQAGYVLCQASKADYSWLSVMAFPTKQILDQGIVMPNNCGRTTASPRPGEITIFVRPLTWWEGLKQ